MKEKQVKAFFRDQVDTHRKVVCVFGENVTKEQMKSVVMDYLRKNEYDDIDDGAPLHTEEELEETTDTIINGGVFDCDMDVYWIDDVEMYV